MICLTFVVPRNINNFTEYAHNQNRIAIVNSDYLSFTVYCLSYLFDDFADLIFHVQSTPKSFDIFVTYFCMLE